MWNKLDMNGYCFVLFCVLVLIHIACKSNEIKSNSDAVKSFSPTPVSLGDLGRRAEDLPELLALIRDPGQLNREAASERLVELSKNQGDRVSGPLIAEISRLCASREEYYKYENFEAVRLLANILAERQNIMALDPLIDCADFVGGTGGSSPNNYATVPAILSYKSKAVPVLTKKLRTGNSEVKCQIARILANLSTQPKEMSPEDIENILNNALKVENDEIVQDCIKGSLRVVRERE